ncbi:MAG: DNA/RNA nuclease SfsA, partial [Bacillota bacterium]|nr:DNA/RNA nuclease SfsA [Bacillota bacterium]
ERGTKHALELIEGVHSGYKAFLVFVIQMKGVKYFTPYKEMDQAFCRALLKAKQNGVHIVAFDCNVTEDRISIADRVKCIV